MSISTCVYVLYPSCQNLRPEVYPRENLLTDLVKILHVSDTNTNVFPSEHAIGSAAIFLAALRSKKLRAPLPLTLLTVFSVLTFLSTVFLKQHSVLDLIAALPVCAIAYFAAYRRKEHN